MVWDCQERSQPWGAGGGGGHGLEGAVCLCPTQQLRAEGKGRGGCRKGLRSVATCALSSRMWCLMGGRSGRAYFRR